MYRLKLLSIAIIAVFALAAIASSAALAENPEILPTPSAKEPLKFTSEGGRAIFTSSTGRPLVECEKTTNKGEFTSADLGVVTINIINCINSVFSKCWSLGDEKSPLGEKSVILIDNADIHLVDILPTGVLALGAAIILLKELFIECLGLLIAGTLIGEMTGLKSGQTVKSSTLVFKLIAKGTQAIRECDLSKAFCFFEKGEVHKKFELLAKVGAESAPTGFEASDKLAFEKEAAFDF